VAEVREPFGSDQQGSSAMPHKMNPELSERIKGLVSLLRGNVVSAMEAMDLWHERDMSHSSTERTTFPDAFGNLAYVLRLLHTRVLGELVVHEQAMAANVERTNGAIYSSRLLNALLATEAIDRTTAYERVKELAQRALQGGAHLRDLAAGDALIAGLLPVGEREQLFDPAYYLRNVRVAYDRLGLDWDGAE
jgi:adenylosuccinate lyase